MPLKAVVPARPTRAQLLREQATATNLAIVQLREANSPSFILGTNGPQSNFHVADDKYEFTHNLSGFAPCPHSSVQVVCRCDYVMGSYKYECAGCGALLIHQVLSSYDDVPNLTIVNHQEWYEQVYLCCRHMTGMEAVPSKSEDKRGQLDYTGLRCAQCGKPVP